MPIRVLHVVGSTDRGGIETWLAHCLLHRDPRELQMDFLVHHRRGGAYDAEYRRLGARVIPCLRPARPLAYARNFERIVRENGPYDIVHGHVHCFSGYAMRLADRAGIPVRIVHSHSDFRGIEAKAEAVRFRSRMVTRAFWQLLGALIRRHATDGLACSRIAGISMFGPLATDGPPWRVLPYGIDLAPFAEAVDGGAVRRELGVPEDALIVGHVGRFIGQKNHRFLLRVVERAFEREPRLFLVLVGQGPLEQTIRDQVSRRGLSRRVAFTGPRADVPRLLAAMDCFLFPSHWEGLGIVVLEAQAAGTPAVVAEGVPEEAVVVSELVERLPLGASEAVWAEAVVSSLGREKLRGPRAAARMEQSVANIERSVAALFEFYRGCMSRSARLA